MCRWVAWSGAPKYLEELVCDPEHSLIDQSKSATSCKTAVNADGFGMAWYTTRKAPCVYRDVRPAWSDANLLQLAHHVISPLFLAHVRASTGTATNHDNCHPFIHGPWSFVHNGQVGGYERIRKRLDSMIPDHLYSSRTGTTDSEALFLIAIGYGLDHDPVGAMMKAVQDLQEISAEQGQLPHMRFSAAWSNGETLFAARYASDNHAPSLFYRQFDDGVTVVSEPFDEGPDAWIEVSSDQVISVRDGKIEKHDVSGRAPSAA